MVQPQAMTTIRVLVNNPDAGRFKGAGLLMQRRKLGVVASGLAALHRLGCGAGLGSKSIARPAEDSPGRYALRSGRAKVQVELARWAMSGSPSFRKRHPAFAALTSFRLSLAQLSTGF